MRVTVVPLAYFSMQPGPQLTPEGLEATVPVPVPALLTFSVGAVATKIFAYSSRHCRYMRHCR
jgi:hypothetical protein